MKAVLLVALVVVALFAQIFSESVEFTSCLDNPSFITNSIDVEPLNARPGENVTVTINGESKQETKGGMLDATIIFRKVKMFEFKFDLCDVSDGGCPVKTGPWVGKVVTQVPKIAFYGVYTSQTDAYDLDHNHLACVQFNFTVVK